MDVAALAEGKLLELVNLVPLGGVELGLVPLKLAGVQGWDGLGAAVLKEWLQDISRTQVGHGGARWGRGSGGGRGSAGGGGVRAGVKSAGWVGGWVGGLGQQGAARQE